ncbi:AraC family transcriptional regulator [Paucibacter soli]|uniref:AraC family transcriptional regulator n=1 Tax=Paucibacter soli TaxID=3133433 RepID=UPI003098A39A
MSTHGLPTLEHARVAGAYAATALETARELGADMAVLHASCALPQEPQATLSVRQYLTLLDCAAAQLDEPAFGLQVGARMRLATFAGYGLVLCTCADFRSAAAQTCRFEGLAHDLGRSEIIEQGPLASYRWHSPWLALPGGRHLAESVLVGIRSFAVWLAGRDLPGVDIGFTHARPDTLTQADYETLLGVPVRFGAAANELRFPAQLLDAQIANADTSLFPALERLAHERLLSREREARQGPAIVGQVRERIQAQLMHERASLAEVAAALHLSARSLQRKLAEAGSPPFSELVDQTRRELVQRYLREPGLSLTEVAFLLGFRQQSSFNHAFRAWFGCTPAQWRGQAV